jgi:hypothetical protein
MASRLETLMGVIRLGVREWTPEIEKKDNYVSKSNLPQMWQSIVGWMWPTRKSGNEGNPSV